MSGQEGIAGVIAGVIAAHHAALSRIGDGLEGWYWTCTCGERDKTGHRYTNAAAAERMDAHVAAAVVAWIEETLASDAAREAVAEVIFDRTGRHMAVETWHPMATAALTAVTAALRDQP